MTRSNDPFDPEPDADDLDDDELFARREERGRGDRPGVTDFVRKAFENTVGSVQNTGTISREALTYVLQQGDKGRREVLRIVAAEVGDFLKNTDLSREVTNILTSIKVDVSASVRFSPADDDRNVVPEVSSKVDVGLTKEAAAKDQADAERAAEERDRIFRKPPEK